MYIPNEINQKQQKSNSLIIGVLILVISLILIGLYLVNGVLKGNINKNNSINQTIANSGLPDWKIGEDVTFSGTIIPRNDHSEFFQFGIKNKDYIGMSSQKHPMSGLSGDYEFGGVIKDIKQFSGLQNTYIIEINNIKPILTKSIDFKPGQTVSKIGNKSIFLDKDIIISDPNYEDQDGKLVGGDFELQTFPCSKNSEDETKNCEKMQKNESTFINVQGLNFFKQSQESNRYYFYTPRYGISFGSEDEQKAQDFSNSIAIIDNDYISQLLGDDVSSLCNDGIKKIHRKENVSYDPIKSQVKINGYDQDNNLLTCLVSLEEKGQGEEKSLVFEFQSYLGENSTSSQTSEVSQENQQSKSQAIKPTTYSSKASSKSSNIKQAVSSSSENAINLNNTISSTATISSNSNQGMNIDLNATSSVSSTTIKDEKITSGAVTYSQYRSAQRGYTAIMPRNFTYEVGGMSEAVAEGIYCFNSLTLANYNTQANGDDIRIMICNGTGDANAYAASKGYRLYRTGKNVFFANALTQDGMQALNNISFK